MKEIWKDIKGYEGFYQVSNLGRIKSLVGWKGNGGYVEREKILKNSLRNVKNNYNRYIVTLRKNKERKDAKVHRLVAEAFIPNPHSYKEVNHIDSNPLNNNVENLEWCNRKMNLIHAYENGDYIKRINTISRECMLELLNSNRNYDEIGQILGIAKGTVFNYIKKFNIHRLYV